MTNLSYWLYRDGVGNTVEENSGV